MNRKELMKKVILFSDIKTEEDAREIAVAILC